ncbi:hypothetical protein ACTHQ1_11045 [Janibacter anophelis]|uniref:hypothetical protein n=1 Tax=Janibacter anophelis TaxID=319054 RepID=UPI003F7E9BBD
MTTTPALGQQLLPSALLLLGVLGVGTGLSARPTAAMRLPTSTRLGVIPLVGLGGLGVTTLVLGHVGLIGPWLPVAWAALGAVALLQRRGEVVRLAQVARSGLADQWRLSPIPVAAVSVGLSIATVAAMAPPFRTDEIEYHWPAALEWAREGRWIDSSYRHVDGFPLMEIIYTAAATWQSYGAAHLLHLLTLVALGLTAGGVARSLGLQGSAAVGTAAMAMPVVWDGAYVAYNDTVVGAYGVGAVAVLLGATHRRRVALGLVTAFLCLAVSAKPTAIGLLGLVGLVVLLERWAPPETIARRTTKEVLGTWVVLTVPVVLTVVAWSLRQLVITGHLIDPLLRQSPSADALSRLPTTADRLVAPFLPFVSGVIGSQEPWGGRTSVLLQILLAPALVYVIARRGEVLRRAALVGVPAWTHWVVVGLAGVRTRFHIATWALVTVSVRAVVEDVGARYPRARLWLELVWGVCVVLGVLDSSLEMVRLIRDSVL